SGVALMCADLVGTTFADHTVIDTATTGCLIRTTVAPANGVIGQPADSPRPTNDRLRRISRVAPRPREGPLTEPTAARQPGRGNGSSCPTPAARGSGRERRSRVDCRPSPTS